MSSKNKKYLLTVFIILLGGTLRATNISPLDDLVDSMDRLSLSKFSFEVCDKKDQESIINTSVVNVHIKTKVVLKANGLVSAVITINNNSCFKSSLNSVKIYILDIDRKILWLSPEIKITTRCEAFYYDFDKLPSTNLVFAKYAGIYQKTAYCCKIIESTNTCFRTLKSVKSHKK